VLSIALLVMTAVAVRAGPAFDGGRIPDIPNQTCQACQEFAKYVTTAVKNGKVGIYSLATLDLCLKIVPADDAAGAAFCKSLVSAGGNTLNELLIENTFSNSPLSSCIALGACPPVECPVGLTRVGNTNVCAYCSTTTTDAFGAPYALSNSNATRLCSVQDYLVVAAGYGGTGVTAAGTYMTGNQCGCDEPSCSSENWERLQTSDYNVQSSNVEPYYNARIDENWVVTVTTGPFSAKLDKQRANSAVYTCVCADLFRPWVYGHF